MYFHGLCKYMECLHDRTHLMHQNSLKELHLDYGEVIVIEITYKIS